MVLDRMFGVGSGSRGMYLVKVDSLLLNSLTPLPILDSVMS